MRADVVVGMHRIGDNPVRDDGGVEWVEIGGVRLTRADVGPIALSWEATGAGHVPELTLRLQPATFAVEPAERPHGPSGLAQAEIDEILARSRG